MTPACLLALVLLGPGDPPGDAEAPRKPNPLAPSLPLLSDEEEGKLDRVIDRFIQADTGRLRGEDARQAVSDFKTLGPEAIPAMIRGLNRAAAIEHSCPALTIAKKLAVMFRATNDPELLEFARENIGAGVTASRHQGVLRELRLLCAYRKNHLPAGAVITYQAPRESAPGPEPPADLSTLSSSDLVKEAVNAGSGARKEQLLKELEKRRADKGTEDLAALAADGSDPKNRGLARDLLRRFLDRQDAATLREKLKDRSPEVRAATAQTAGSKGLPFEDDLIPLLSDKEEDVRQAARKALSRLSHGADFGPKRNASEAEQAAAARRWRDWLAGQGGH
jgi:hypothetical protein